MAKIQLHVHISRKRSLVFFSVEETKVIFRKEENNQLEKRPQLELTRQH